MEPAFSGATIVLPLINETTSLEQTVEILENENGDDICEYLVIVCKKTTEQARRVSEKLQSKFPKKLKIVEQTRPFLGGAIRDAFDIAKGSHTVMMATDLETDPKTVKEFIRHARLNPKSIVTATRWSGSGGFSGYDPLKYILNFLFQCIFRILYRTRLSDLTFGFRIFPTDLVQRIDWVELKHPFLFETIVKPLKLGIPVTEVPSAWKSRDEGESQNTFMTNFIYFRVGIKVWLQPPSQFYNEPLNTELPQEAR